MSGNASTWARQQTVGDGYVKAVLKEYAHWASEDYTSWVSNPTLVTALEMDIKTIRRCRDKLVELGYLIETSKRAGGTGNIIVYQIVAPAGSAIVQIEDRRTGDMISLSPPSLEEYLAKQGQKRSPSKNGPPKGSQKRSPSKNGAPPHLAERGTKNGSKGVPDFPEGVPKTDPDFIDLGSELSELGETRASDVDETKKTSHTANDETDDPASKPTGFERFWTVWPSASGRKQAKEVCLSHWIANGLDAHAELIIAHVEAMKRTQHWKTGGDPTPIRYLEQKRWRDGAPESEASDAGDSDWFLSASGITAQGERVGVQQRDGEPMPDYLVRVAQASGRGPWIDHVLREARKGNEQRYQQIVSFFGDKLLPPDFYA